MIKIGLDAGHGLYTSGKQTPNGIKEWALNDKVRDKVVKILSDYECEIIHADNGEGATDESLSSRLNKYINVGVKAFVSIHHNAYSGKWNSATGVETYVDNNPTYADMRLANCIQERLTKYTGLRNRGVKRCDFYVINQDKIPAVLVEGGFMDSTVDYPVITSDEGQTAYAKAVAEGLIEFLGLTKKETIVKPNTNNSVVNNGILYKVQVGVFSEKENAEAVAEKLKTAGFSAIIVSNTSEQVTTIQVVKKTNAEIAKEIYKGICSDPRWDTWGNGAVRVERLKAAGYDPYVVQEEVNKLF